MCGVLCGQGYGGGGMQGGGMQGGGMQGGMMPQQGGFQGGEPYGDRRQVLLPHKTAAPCRCELMYVVSSLRIWLRAQPARPAASTWQAASF